MRNSIKHLTHKNTPRWVVLSLDLLLSAFSFGLAYFITEALSFEKTNAASYLFPLSFVLIFRLIAFIATKSYTGIIRYTSTQDAVRIFFAVAISSIAILFAEVTAYAYLGTQIIKPAIIIIDAFILIFFLTSFRISFKLLYNQYAPFNNGDNRKELLIYGAGEAGIIVKRSFEQNSSHGRKVIAFIDDNPKLQGKSAEGVNIYPPEVDFNTLTADRNNLILK